MLDLETEFLGPGPLTGVLGVMWRTVVNWMDTGLMDAIRLPSDQRQIPIRIPVDEVDWILGPLGSDDA